MLVLADGRLSFRHELARLSIEGAVAAGGASSTRGCSRCSKRSRRRPRPSRAPCRGCGCRRVLRYAPAAAAGVRSRSAPRGGAPSSAQWPGPTLCRPRACRPPVLPRRGAHRLRRAGRTRCAARADRRAAAALRRRAWCRSDARAPRPDVLDDGPHAGRVSARRRSGRDPRAALPRTRARTRLRRVQPSGNARAARPRSGDLGNARDRARRAGGRARGNADGPELGRRRADHVLRAAGRHRAVERAAHRECGRGHSRSVALGNLGGASRRSGSTSSP